MSNRYKYSSRWGVAYLLKLLGLVIAIHTNSCVTDAKVGEFQIPATNTSGSGGSEGIGTTGEVGGSEKFETNNGNEPNGDENGQSIAGTGGTVPKEEIHCAAKDHFNNFEVTSCDHEFSSGKIELGKERAWTATGQDPYAWGPPLVANLTDDDADGDVDLCDSPDILIVANFELFCLPLTDCTFLSTPFIRLIDGKDGTLHESVLFAHAVYPGTTPAIGDIDRDGSPDVVAASRTSMTSEVFGESVIAFERDGRIKWKSQKSASSYMKVETLAIALADLDNNDEVEVIVGFDVFDGRNGDLIVPGAEIVDSIYDAFFGLYGFHGVLRVAPTVADLDDDGNLEVVIGPIAFRYDGSLYYNDKSGFFSIAASASVFSPWTGSDEMLVYNIYPVVADLDDDDEPEVLFTAGSMVYILESDGRRKKDLDLSLAGIDQVGPATINDFNGDDKPEIAFDTSLGLVVLDRNLGLVWFDPNLENPLMFNYPEHEPGCVSSFDFRGDGVAEVIYSDGRNLRLLDVQNQIEIANFVREGSKSCPVVADVDDDDNAEIVIVNQKTASGDAPSIQIIGEQKNRWVPTRRIWNEYNYHVTNVLEDSTIPRAEPPIHDRLNTFWDRLNTFRANAQTASDRLCEPILIE